MIIINEAVKWLLTQKQKANLLSTTLSRWEVRLNALLLEMKTNKQYDQLQAMEEVLRRSLIKTLEVKGEVATTLLKKDFEMNKELLAKIQAQVVPQPEQKPHTNPRFGLN